MENSPLVIAGAQKAASTALSRWFASTPRIADLSPRECVALDARTHHLRTFVLLARSKHAQRRGQIPMFRRPEIFHNPTIRQRAAASFPGAVVITSLRSPIERSISGWRHYRRMGVLDPDLSIPDCIEAWRLHGPASGAGQVVAYSLYSFATKSMIELFRHPFFVFDEDLLSRPLTALGNAITLLGDPSLPDSLPTANSKEETAQKGPRPSPLLGKVSYSWQPKDHYYTARPGLWQLAAALRVAGRSLRNMEVDQPPEVSQKDRELLGEVLVPDLDLLEGVIERTVPQSWRNPLM